MQECGQLAVLLLSHGKPEITFLAVDKTNHSLLTEKWASLRDAWGSLPFHSHHYGPFHGGGIVGALGTLKRPCTGFPIVLSR